MAFSLNRITLIGFVTEKPELKQIPSGTNVCDLNLQVKDKVEKDDGTKQPLTSFHTVTLWSKLAEIVDQYVNAGSQVYVSGRLKTDEWDDESGQKKRKTKVIAQEIILLDSRNPIADPGESSLVSGGLNSAEVIGNLTREPELRQTTNGQNVANFGIATNRRWQNQNTGESQEETEFHNIVVWGALAEEVANNFKKGQKAYIQGRCVTRTWDSPDGQKKRTTEINANQVLLLGVTDNNLASSSGDSGPSYTPVEEKSSNPSTPADELPEIPEIKHESKIKPEDLPF
jgi:single-strand DNA-binding protein